MPRDGNLRWFRTTLLGRAPGFAPGPPVVGPWRDVWLAGAAAAGGRRCDRGLDGGDGVLQIETDVSGGPARGRGRLAHDVAAGRWRRGAHAPTRDAGGRTRTASLDLYDVRIRAGGGELVRAASAFASSALRGGPDADGFELQVNGTPIFARGVVWTPVPDDELRALWRRCAMPGST